MNIEQLATTYEPDEKAVDAVRAADIVLLVGISGAGKDTIQSYLLKMPGYHKIVTHTTRAPRANNGVMEQDGREYHFVTREQMQQMLEDHQLVEVNHYSGNFYGTSVNEFVISRQLHTVAISNIDVNGVSAFRNIASDNVRALFILPPDYDSWLSRLAKRYHSKEELDQVFQSRRATAIDELEHALSVPYYHFIINDDLERAVRVIDEIAHRKDMFNRHDDEARLKARDLLEAIKSHHTA